MQLFFFPSDRTFQGKKSIILFNYIPISRRYQTKQSISIWKYYVSQTIAEERGKKRSEMWKLSLINTLAALSMRIK